jgi:hypothetical protein
MHIERCGRMVITPASYSEGLEFIPLSEDQLFCLRIFWFSCFFMLILGAKNKPCPIYYTLVRTDHSQSLFP